MNCSSCCQDRGHGETRSFCIKNTKFLRETPRHTLYAGTPWLNNKKQLLTYLKLTNTKLGYILNFGGALMKNGIVRIINGTLLDN